MTTELKPELKIYLQNIVDENSNVFKKYTDNIGKENTYIFEDTFKLLIKSYIDNCGISYGYRSVYWGFATMILNNYADAEEKDIDEYAKIYFENWDEFKSFDAGLVHVEQTIAIAFKVLDTEIRNEDLPLFSNLILQFIAENQELY